MLASQTTLTKQSSNSAYQKRGKTVRTPLPYDFVPNNYTVLCGRGKEFFNAIGNRRFRIIVDMNLERYSNTQTKSQKSQIVSEIVEIIRGAGGGFVKQNPKDGSWYEVGDSVAREKVGALFRDCLHEQYSSAAKSKTARRRANLQRQQMVYLRKLQGKKSLDDDDITVATECSFDETISEGSFSGGSWVDQDIRASRIFETREFPDIEEIEFDSSPSVFAI